MKQVYHVILECTKLFYCHTSSLARFSKIGRSDQRPANLKFPALYRVHLRMKQWVNFTHAPNYYSWYKRGQETHSRNVQHCGLFLTFNFLTFNFRGYLLKCPSPIEVSIRIFKTIHKTIYIAFSRPFIRPFIFFIFVGYSFMVSPIGIKQSPYFQD